MVQQISRACHHVPCHHRSAHALVSSNLETYQYNYIIESKKQQRIKHKGCWKMLETTGILVLFHGYWTSTDLQNQPETSSPHQWLLKSAQFFSADAAAVSEPSPTPRWTSKHHGFATRFLAPTSGLANRRLPFKNDATRTSTLQ